MSDRGRAPQPTEAGPLSPDAGADREGLAGDPRDEGPDALTVQAIVERAGSSVGSFYARFAGKEDLLGYLGERVWREAAGRWDEALASRDWAGSTSASSWTARCVAGRSGQLARLVPEGAGRVHGAGEDAYGAFHAHVIAGLEEMLLTRADQIAHPDPAVAVPIGLRAALAVLEPRGASHGGSSLSREQRGEEASRLLMSYLAGAPPRAPGSGDVDFFDIWG